MTITFPNATLFATWPIITTKFRLQPRQSISRQANGMPIAVDFGLAVWTATYISAPLEHGRCVQLEAALNSLDGAINPIFGGDTRLEYPYAYPTGAFTDAGAILAWGGSGKSVSMNGLPAGFIITAGDYFRLATGGVRYLFQAVESITANGSGVTADFEIRPHYPTGASGTPLVFFKKPQMAMIVDPATVAFADEGSLTGTVTFATLQAFV